MVLFSLISKQNSSPVRESVDIWRDTPLRYVGYANEIGEAFRFRFPRLLIPSYGAAILYVFGDTIDKTQKALKTGMSAHDATIVSADAFAWQFLASVAIPGFTINRIVTYSRNFLIHSTGKLHHPSVIAWGPTFLGLGMIPFIIHPIDSFVNKTFENAIRPMFGIDDLINSTSLYHHHEQQQQIQTTPQQTSLTSTIIHSSNKIDDDDDDDKNQGIFTKAQLDAMSLYIDEHCTDVNTQFNACKAKHMDPEQCLTSGKNVMICVKQLFMKLNQPKTKNQFDFYMDCLENNGGEFSKCRKHKEELDKCLVIGADVGFKK